MIRYVAAVPLLVAMLGGCGRSNGTPRALQALDAAIQRGEYRGVHAVLVAKDGQLVHGDHPALGYAGRR